VRAAADIVVIGAGIIGCAIADELARRGAAVQVVDPRAAGMGATQASAGVLAPYIEAHEGTPLLELAVRSLELYDEFVARIVTDSGMAVPYRRTGTLDVAFDERDLRALEAKAAVLARLGVSAPLLSAAGTRDEEPQVGEAACGALLVETHGFVGATDLTRALATAARRRGAHFLAPGRVHRIVPRGTDAVVETDNGSLACASVVLAAGSWSGELPIDGIDVRPPVRPVRGQLLSLAWQGAPLRRVTWSSRCYLVPWDDGTLLVGATVEEAGFDERATAEGVRGLIEAACDVTPQARSAGFTAARVGLRPATIDGLPLIGPSSVLPTLMYATGHYRNGVLLAPLTARLVADAMLDRRVDPMLAPLSPARFGAL
jgi:glycine oxidase